MQSSLKSQAPKGEVTCVKVTQQIHSRMRTRFQPGLLTSILNNLLLRLSFHWKLVIGLNWLQAISNINNTVAKMGFLLDQKTFAHVFFKIVTHCRNRIWPIMFKLFKNTNELADPSYLKKKKSKKSCLYFRIGKKCISKKIT